MLSTPVQGSQELYICKYMITFMYQYVLNFLYIGGSPPQMITSVHKLRNTADWVRSFLTNRRQKVEVQLCNTTEHFSLTGVH